MRIVLLIPIGTATAGPLLIDRTVVRPGTRYPVEPISRDLSTIGGHRLPHAREVGRRGRYPWEVLHTSVPTLGFGSVDSTRLSLSSTVMMVRRVGAAPRIRPGVEEPQRAVDVAGEKCRARRVHASVSASPAAIGTPIGRPVARRTTATSRRRSRRDDGARPGSAPGRRYETLPVTTGRRSGSAVASISCNVVITADGGDDRARLIPLTRKAVGRS